MPIQTLLITGPTGVGKSHLLLDLQSSRSPWDIHVVDPLGNEHLVWTNPSPAALSAVAFDHVCFLRDAGSQVRAARAWCQRHGKALILVDQRRSDFAAVDVDVYDTSLEIQLERQRGDPCLTLIKGDARLQLTRGVTRDHFIAEARRFLQVFE